MAFVRAATIPDAYQGFLLFAGSAAQNCSQIEEAAHSLFSARFKKIVNGQLAVDGSEHLGRYLGNFVKK